MKQTLITTALALGLGFLSTPSFAAGSYIVNGHPASPAEAQHLVANGVQQGAWVVNGYGIFGLGRAQRPEVLLRPRRVALRLTQTRERSTTRR
jgi:hypothetical protein